MSRNDQYLAGQLPFANSTRAAEDEEPFFAEIDEPAAPSSPTPTADENAPPQWFRGPAARKKPSPSPQTSSTTPQNRQQPASAQQARKSLRRKPIIETGEEEPKNLTWQGWVRHWVYDGGGAGFGVSVLVHVVLLMLMSLYVLHQPEDVELITTVEQTDVPDLASVKEVDLDVDLKPEIVEQIKNPEIEPAPLSMPNLGIGSLATSLDSVKAGGLALKIPSQAVTKGSFTVWTEPEDPQPGERYVIMIQIKLKNDVKMYPLRDLKGKVVGTDMYTDHFGGPTESARIPVKNQTVVIKACDVPGAQQLVKDTITVESKMLNEKQTIELEF